MTETIDTNENQTHSHITAPGIPPSGPIDTPQRALSITLWLAITARDERYVEPLIAMAESIAADLHPDEIEYCKHVARIWAFG